MSGRIATRTATAPAALLATVIALVSSAALTGCADGDGTRASPSGEMGGENENMGPGTDANDAILASLAFASAADDALHRCLFETLSASASREGLESIGTFERQGAVSKVWCDASGRDGEDCLRGFLDTFRERGSRGIALLARRDGIDEVVTEYGYEASRVSAAGAGRWSIAFERRLGDKDEFVARFTRFDEAGRDDAGQIALFERFGYGTEELSVLHEETEYASTDALLNALAASPERFERIIVERLDAVLEKFVTRASAPDSGLAPERVEELIAGARTFLDRTRDAVRTDGDELHALLREQVLLDDCR